MTSTELLLRIGGNDLIVQVDSDIPRDTLVCNVETLSRMMQATYGDATTRKARRAARRVKRTRPRPGRLSNAISPATLAKMRGEVTTSPARDIIEDVMVQGKSMRVVANRMGLHPTTINRIRKELNKRYGLRPTLKPGATRG